MPIVILDAKAALHATDMAPLSSIDSAIMQQMFGDGLALFKSLLARMLRDYADLALPMCVSLRPLALALTTLCEESDLLLAAWTSNDDQT